MQKRIISILLCFVLLIPLCLSVAAVDVNWPAPKTEEECGSAIQFCLTRKELAHEMAQSARALGYSEDHTIIKSAQSDWWAAHNKQVEYTTKLQTLVDERLAAEAEAAKYKAPEVTWTGSKITRSGGVNWGPSGFETYYNLNMSGVVYYMRQLGYDEEHYPYWVRSDGCKMLGDFIMVAANLNNRPKGTIVECSLGWAIVADTGSFASNGTKGWNQLDIAVNW